MATKKKRKSIKRDVSRANRALSISFKRAKNGYIVSVWNNRTIEETSYVTKTAKEARKIIEKYIK